MKKKIIIWTICFIIFINLPFWDFFTGEDYSFSNRDGSYTYVEMTGKGGDLKSTLLNYGGYLALHPEKDKDDNNLYRTFTIKPWRIWEWRQMIMHSDRFQLPYLDTSANPYKKK
jgi:hypothetical protein